MNKAKKSGGSLVQRVQVIKTVQTPLGFFVLIVLIVEAIFGVIAGFSMGTDRTYLIIGMLALIFLLVGIVSVLALVRPEALYGGRPEGIDQPSPEDVGTSRSDLSPFEMIADEGTPVVLCVEPLVGSVVDPQTKIFRVTFSQPMRTGWSFLRGSRGELPKLHGEPVVSPDGKTISAGMSLLPGCVYAFWLNDEKHRSFVGRSGKPAVPYFVYFRTADEVPNSSEHTDFAE